MATYSSPEYTNNAPIAVHGERRNVQMLRATIAIPAAIATTDALNFGYMPAGARVVGGYLKADDMDSNGTPLLTFNVGDAGSGARLFSAAAGAKTGVTDQLPVAALDYQFTAKTLITGAPAANPATGVAGNLTLTLLYVVEE